MATSPMADVAAFQIQGPRKRQEDAALHVRHGRGRLLVVADGMGGEPAGDVASISAVLGFEKGFGVPSDESEHNLRWAMRFMAGLRGALDGMAEALARGEGEDGMATTLAAVWADPDGLRWLSVGDSVIWTGDTFGKNLPRRLNRRHGEDNRVDSALMASTRPFRAESIEAQFCVTEIDLHPGPRIMPPGQLVLVGSDGMDVLDHMHVPGSWLQRGPGPQDVQVPEAWQRAFRDMNPRDFLARVESVLAAGAAEDNTTAIALRAPAGRSLWAEQYVPVMDAPDREVFGGDSH